MVGILSGFHFDLTQVEITDKSNKEESMEFEVQDEGGQEEKMPTLAEELEDVKLQQESEKCTVIAHSKTSLNFLT